MVRTGDSKRNFIKVIFCPEERVFVRTSTDVLFELNDFPGSMLGMRSEKGDEKEQSASDSC